MKKSSFLLTLCLLALLAFLLCACGQGAMADYASAYQCVAEAGFPMKNMNAETLFSIYEEIKAADRVITNTETKSLARVSPGQNARAGNIPSSDLSFSITTGKVISGGEISSVTVYVYYEWDSFTPLACLEDAIIVSWDEDFIFKENSFTAKHYSFADSLTEALSQPDEQNQQGLGWYIDLQNSSVGSYGSGHFSLLPKASLQDGTTYLSQVIAIYGHKELPFQGISLSAEDFGVQIINDDASCASSSSFRHD